MKKAFLWVGMVLMAGLPACFFDGGHDLGVSPENPLGDFDKIKEALEAEKFRERPRVTDWSVFNEFVDGSEYKIHQFKDTATPSTRESSHRITILLDEAGKVRGFGAEFYTGSKQIGYTLSRTETMARQLWTEVFGSLPTFEEKQEGEGIHYRKYLIAEPSKDGVRSRWRKRYCEQLKESSIIDFLALVWE
jgi:hypothetical protein